jgi:hypothetical protein
VEIEKGRRVKKTGYDCGTVSRVAFGCRRAVGDDSLASSTTDEWLLPPECASVPMSCGWPPWRHEYRMLATMRRVAAPPIMAKRPATVRRFMSGERLGVGVG